MATMKEIAQLSGVSRGTVDRVLNNRGGVQKDTADRIRQIARETGYIPDEAAQMLSAKKRGMKLDYILFNPKRACFFEDVERGILHAAAEMEDVGTQIRIRYVDSWTSQAFLEKLDEAVAEGTDGIAIAGLNTPEVVRRVRQLTSEGIPVVASNSDIPGSGRLAFVGSDAYRAGWMAAGLVRLFFREPIRLGVVLGFRSSTCHTERIRGLTDALAHYGIPCAIAFMESNNDDEFDSYDIVRQQMLRHPNINVLYLATGSGAFGACRALEGIPLTLRPCVIGFDVTEPILEMLRKRVITATISQDPKRQGAEPLRILFRYLAFDERLTEEKQHTDCRIVLSESV